MDHESMLPPSLIDAERVGDFRLRLHFEDGTVGEVDLEPELEGPVFGPLHEPRAFRAFAVTPGSLEWNNGADLSAEFLYARTRGWVSSRAAFSACTIDGVHVGPCRVGRA